MAISSGRSARVKFGTRYCYCAADYRIRAHLRGIRAAPIRRFSATVRRPARRTGYSPLITRRWFSAKLAERRAARESAKVCPAWAVITRIRSGFASARSCAVIAWKLLQSPHPLPPCVRGRPRHRWPACRWRRPGSPRNTTVTRVGLPDSVVSVAAACSPPRVMRRHAAAGAEFQYFAQHIGRREPSARAGAAQVDQRIAVRGSPRPRSARCSAPASRRGNCSVRPRSGW